MIHGVCSFPCAPNETVDDHERFHMGIQYASLEEAWSNSAPVQQYPVDDSFDVAKSDVRQRSPYAELDGDVTMALESAYPAQQRASARSPRQSTTLMHHTPNGVPCDAADMTDGSVQPQYIAPSHTTSLPSHAGSVVSHAAAPTVDTHGPDRNASYAHDTHHVDTARTHVPAMPASQGYETHTPFDERVALYDILVFMLFGLLMVLALHEAASIGELIGRKVR